MVDRRVQKTLLALHRSLITLILRKGYDAVTIKDIIEEANVGRSTFYAHYEGKEALLEGGLADLRKLLTARQKVLLADPVTVRARPFSFSLALFEHAHDYHDVYRAMVGRRGGAVVIGRLRELLSELVRRELMLSPVQGVIADIPSSAVVQHVVGALLSVLTWWVDEKTRLEPAQVDAIFRRLTLPAFVAPSRA